MTKRLIFGAVGLLVVGVLVAWFAGRPAYRRHQEARAVAQANEFLARKELQKASLSARQALRMNPQNLEACRIMAGLAELAQAPQALDWRRRVAELSPTVDNRLALAATALRMQAAPYVVAAQTLRGLEAAGRDIPAYHVMSAELALKLNRPQEAEACFESAIRLEPTNELHRLNLAVLRLASTNEVLAAAARGALEQLLTLTNLAPVALRWLVQDALRRNEMPAADGFSRQLVADPRVALEDRLQRLEVLQRLERPEAGDLLVQLQSQAATNAAQIYALSSWMVAHSQAATALQWLTNRTAHLQAEYPVALARVDCYVATREWAELEKFLEGKDWGESEYLRQAFLARAAIERNQNAAADARWRLAVQRAGDRLGPLATLLTMAGAWGRPDTAEAVLWRITKNYPSERWAFRELERLCVLAGNTAALNRLYAAIVANDPNDFVARNNLAATALLLKLDLPKAHQTAADLYRQHPQEAVVVSTHAYSLYLQGRAAEGLAAFKTLKPEALQDPSVALYYALLLRAQSQTNNLSPYLTLAQRATLLPEEKEFLTELLKTP